MELRRLRYFCAVAQSANLTRAARQLHLTGQSLSEQIRRLERELGAELFQRSASGMTLTEAGRALLPEALATLAAAERARQAVAATLGPLRIGVPAGAPAELVRRLRTAAAGAARLCDATTAEQVERLADGRLDLGLVTLPVVADGLSTLVLSREPMGVVLGRSHPLAARETLSYQELAGQELVWFRRERAPGHHDHVLEVCHRNGWHPTLRPGAGRRSVFLAQLTGPDGVVALQPASAVTAEPELTWRPLAQDPPVLGLAAAWRTDNRSAALRTLLAKLAST